MFTRNFECCDKTVGQAGHGFPGLPGRKQTELGNAVASPLLGDRLQALRLVGIPRTNQRAGFNEAKAHLPVYGQIFCPACLHQFQLQTALGRIEAGVEDSAVGLRCPGKNIGPLLDDHDLRTSQCETTGNRATDHPGTDDGNVECCGEALDHGLAFIFVVRKRNQQAQRIEQMHLAGSWL